jgi:hypothetical protein
MICPNCLSKLYPQKKKLGTGSQKWLYCSFCGYRIKIDTIHSIEIKELKEFCDNIKLINSNNIFKNED